MELFLTISLTPLASCLHSSYLRQPPSPAHSVADCSVTQFVTVLQVLIRLSDYSRGFAPHFAYAYRVAYPAPPRTSASPPEVTHKSSTPCRPQTPWYEE